MGYVEFVYVTEFKLWDVASDQDAVDLIRSNEGDAQRMSEDLLYYSLEQGTKDNVTIMVVTL
jgi:serine/threonine protein phosphatase PrpC